MAMLNSQRVNHGQSPCDVLLSPGVTKGDKGLPSRRRDPTARAPPRGARLLSGVAAWERPKPGQRASLDGMFMEF